MRRVTIAAGPFTIALAASSSFAVVRAVRGPLAGTADFGAFWRAGRWVASGRRDDLYPVSSFGGAGGGTFKGFVNPPHVAPLFAPLSRLPLHAAAIVFACANAALLSAFLVVVWRWLRQRAVGPVEATLVVLLIAGSAAVATTFANGAMSLVALLAAITVVRFDAAGDSLVTGAALAVLSMKPQYMILPFVYVVARRRWRAVAAAVGGTALLVAGTLPFTGLEAWRQYPSFLDRYASSLDVWQLSHTKELWLPKEMLNVRGLLVRALGSARAPSINALSTLVLAASVVAVVVIGRRVARHADATMAMTGWAAVLSLAVVTSQHTNIADGALLFVPLVVLFGIGDRPDASRLIVGCLLLDLAMLLGNPSGHAPAIPWSAIAAVSLTFVAFRHQRSHHAGTLVRRSSPPLAPPIQPA